MTDLEFAYEAFETMGFHIGVGTRLAELHDLMAAEFKRLHDAQIELRHQADCMSDAYEAKRHIDWQQAGGL